MESGEINFICEVLASNLVKLINDGSAAATQSTYVYSKTCYLDFEGNLLVAASSDGKRLAIAKTLCEEVENNNEEMIFLASDLKELGRTLESYADSKVTIWTDNSKAFFKIDDSEFSIEKVNVHFSKYRRVLPDEVYTRLKINTPDLINVLEKTVMIAQTNNPNHTMVLVLMSEENELTISAYSQDCGVFYEKFNAEIEQNSLIIGFNVNYFLDALKALGNNTVVMEFSDSEAITQMRRENDNSFSYLLMPVRLRMEDRTCDLEGDYPFLPY